MIRRVFFVVCVLLTTKTAAAEDRKAQADRLVAEGSRLGKQGNLRGAIEKFKEAESLWPSPVNDCNIGLGYRRLGNLPRAHLYLSRCRARWISGDNLPGWLDGEIGKVRDELASGRFAPVSLTTIPGNAELAISALAGDDVRSPTTVWLPFGSHTVEARKTGYRVSERVVDVDDRTAKSVRIPLQGVRESDVVAGSGLADSSSTVANVDVEQRQTGTNWQRVGWYVGGAGIGLLAVAAGYNVLVERPAHDEARDAGEFLVPNVPTSGKTDQWRDWEGKNRNAMILYVVGGAVTATGLALIFFGPDGVEEAPMSVSAYADGSGGFAQVGWSF